MDAYLRFVVFWIAVESLFGTTHELRYRISQRITLFIEEDTKNRGKELFKKTLKLYDRRCQEVHGGRDSQGEKGKDIGALLEETETIIRISMAKILKNDDLVKTFSTQKREDYLDNLIFDKK